MLKRLSIFVATCAFALLTACSTMPGNTPAQNAINTTATACSSNNAAIVATNQAVLSGVLKGDNARAALTGLTAAQSGCNAALAAIKAAEAAAASAPK